MAAKEPWIAVRIVARYRHVHSPGAQALRHRHLRLTDRGRLWRPNAVYLATDLMALDVVCRKTTIAKRAEKGLQDRTCDCRHSETAIERGLGVGDAAPIEPTAPEV